MLVRCLLRYLCECALLFKCKCNIYNWFTVIPHFHISFCYQTCFYCVFICHGCVSRVSLSYSLRYIVLHHVQVVQNWCGQLYHADTFYPLPEATTLCIWMRCEWLRQNIDVCVAGDENGLLMHFCSSSDFLQSLQNRPLNVLHSAVGFTRRRREVVIVRAKVWK